MMKRFLFVAIFSYSISTQAQVQSFRADDGTEVSMEVISVDPDRGRNASAYSGFFGPEGISNLGLSYYQPKKFYINALGGFIGGSLDASIFLVNKLKMKNIKQSIKAVGYTRYVVKVPANKRKSFGFHTGASYVNYNKMGDAPSASIHSALGVFGGLTLLSAKHAHWKIYDSYREAQGTLINRLNADFIYYVKREMPVGFSSSAEAMDAITNKVGFRIYYDGKATFWSRGGRVSLNYMLGVGQSSVKDAFPGFAGIGIGYNW